MGRHAGQTGKVRSRSPQGDDRGGGTAVLTEPRADSGPGLSSAFGLSATRRALPDLPAIGTPEHTALLSGGLDLASMVAAQEQGPLVGFSPIVLDPAGPTVAEAADLADSPDSLDLPDSATTGGRGGAAGSRDGGSSLPSRRSMRSGASSRAGSSRSGDRPGSRPLARQSSARGGLPGPRPANATGASRGRLRPVPPVVTAPPTGALGLDEMLATLDALPVLAPRDDSTPTGELARPFVTGTDLADWVTEAADVPPPISVDVFQKAVRAGLAPEAAAAAFAAAPGADLDEVVARVVEEVATSRAATDRGTRATDRGDDGVPGRGDDGVPGRGTRATDRGDDGVPGRGTRATDRGDDGVPGRRTRREQRARERALTSVRGVTVRRLAKGGVLAITALGVVSSATPQTLGALGLDRDDVTAGRDALDFASALAPKVNPPTLSPEAVAQRQQLQREQVLRRELADQVVDEAGNASTTAGAALLGLAFEQDEAMEARRRAELARAAREANRNPKRFARALVAERGWNSTQFQCLDRLWTRESQWNYRAVNRSSGAYGIAQALPGSKMSAAGDDWRTNAITQIKWGLNYIDDRYGTPCGAWAHSEAKGWY